MANRHWLVDLKNEKHIACEAGFRGFIYRKEQAKCLDYCMQLAEYDIEGFHHKLNGGFAAFVIMNNRMIAINDRFGYGKIYFHENQEGVIIGTDFNEVVERLEKRTPCRIGISEFTRFGYPLFNRTFLEEIKVLPPGTRIELDLKNGRICKEERYWKYTFEENENSSKMEMLSQLWNVFTKAVEDCFYEHNEVYAVGNSGGLDSRSILAVAKDKGYDFTAYTIGTRGSETMQIADKIAKILELKHERIDVRSDFLPKYYEEHMTKRPMITVASTWYYSAIEKLKGCSRNLIGLYGDNTLGIHLVDKYLKMNNIWDQYDYHSLAEDEYLAYYTRLDYGIVRNIYMAMLDSYEQPTDIKKYDQWNFENRQFRFIMEEDWVSYLGQMSMRCPFMHNKLTDFAFSMPYKWRYDRKLYQEALTKMFPDVARIRFDRCAYSASDPRWLRKPKHLVRGAINRINRNIAKGKLLPGVNKRQQEWLLSEPNISFIRENLSRPCPVFNEYFKEEKIMNNVDKMVEENWSVASNILTLKLWLEKYCS